MKKITISIATKHTMIHTIICILFFAVMSILIVKAILETIWGVMLFACGLVIYNVSLVLEMFLIVYRSTKKIYNWLFKKEPPKTEYNEWIRAIKIYTGNKDWNANTGDISFFFNEKSMQEVMEIKNRI